MIKETDYHQVVISASVYCHFNCTILLWLSNDSDALAKDFFFYSRWDFPGWRKQKTKASKVTEAETVKIPDRSIWLIRQNEKGSDIDILGLLNVISHNMSVIKCPDILVTFFWFCSGCCATPKFTIPKIQLLCYDLIYVFCLREGLGVFLVQLHQTESIHSEMAHKNIRDMEEVQEVLWNLQNFEFHLNSVCLKNGTCFQINLVLSQRGRKEKTYKTQTNMQFTHQGFSIVDIKTMTFI